MPTLREPTPQELEYLSQQGVDVAALPAKLEFDDNPTGTQGNSASVGQTIADVSKAHAGRTIGGGLGSLALGAAGLALGGPIGMLAGATIGGLGTGAAGDTYQEMLMGKDKYKALQDQANASSAANPMTAMTTDFTEGALASGGAFSPRTAIGAAKGLIGRNTLNAGEKALLMRAGEEGITPELSSIAEKATSRAQDIADLKNVGLQVGVNEALGPGVNVVMGHGTSVNDVIGSGLGGALFARQSALGKAFNRGFSPEPTAHYDPAEGGNIDTTAKTEEVSSPFRERGEDGRPTISDEEVTSLWKEQNKKPEYPDNLNYADKARLETARKNRLAMPLEQQRQALHDKLIAEQAAQVEEKRKQDAIAYAMEKDKLPVTRPESTDVVGISNEMDRLNRQNQTAESFKKQKEFEAAKQEVAQQEAVRTAQQEGQQAWDNQEARQEVPKKTAPIDKTTFPEIPVKSEQPNVQSEKPNTTISPDNPILKDILPSEVGRPENWLDKADKWADEILKPKTGQEGMLSGPIDPDVLTAYAVKGAVHITRGIQDFAAWSKQMVKEFGESIKPHLNAIYAKATQLAGKDITPNARLYKPLRVLESTVDAIRNSGHPSGPALANATDKMYNDRYELHGRWANKFLEGTKNLSTNDSAALWKATRYQLENKKDGMFLLKTQPQREAFRLVKQFLKEVHDEGVARNIPITESDGSRRQRKRDPFYLPTRPSTGLMNEYKSGDQTKIDAKDKAFIDYQKKLGYGESEIKHRLDSWKESISGSFRDSESGNQQHFNAVRKAQGIPLPPDWTNPDWRENMASYFKSVAPDFAFYKHLESNPETMAALGMTHDPWGNKIESKPEQNMMDNDAVRTLVQSIKGHAGLRSDYDEHVISSLMTAGFVGPGTEVHKFSSNQINAMPWLNDAGETVAYFSHAITDLQKGMEHASANGVYKMRATNLSSWLKSTNTWQDYLHLLKDTVRDVYSFGDLTTKVGTGIMQAGFEGALPRKIASANAGNKTAQQQLKNIDSDYIVGKTYSDAERSKLASYMINQVQGTGDARTMPPFMLKDSELSGFFKLSHWSIAMTNNFMKNAVSPMGHGDYGPMIKSLFGAVIGGYMIKELREKVQGKKGNIPSLDEIYNSSKGFSADPSFKNPLLYNIMASASYAGFGGILSQFARVPFDIANKNKPQGFVFPLDEFVTDAADTAKDVFQAYLNDPNFNWAEASRAVTAHMATSNFQLGRTVVNQAVNVGLLDGTSFERIALKKQLEDKTGQLRRFRMAEGLPYNEQEAGGNPYMNLEQKKFKMSTDPEEFGKMLPQLINNIVDKYRDNPFVMFEKIRALKQNQYATMPSLDEDPLSFKKYVDFLTRQVGPEKAQEMVKDYYRHKIINQVKASIVPSF